MSNEIYDFYNAGAEIGRLEKGLGRIEFFRTKRLLDILHMTEHDDEMLGMSPHFLIICTK